MTLQKCPACGRSTRWDEGDQGFQVTPPAPASRVCDNRGNPEVEGDPPPVWGIELRPEVRWFAEQMELFLREHPALVDESVYELHWLAGMYANRLRQNLHGHRGWPDPSMPLGVCAMLIANNTRRAAEDK